MKYSEGIVTLSMVLDQDYAHETKLECTALNCHMIDVNNRQKQNKQKKETG